MSPSPSPILQVGFSWSLLLLALLLPSGARQVTGGGRGGGPRRDVRVDRPTQLSPVGVAPGNLAKARLGAVAWDADLSEAPHV